LIRSIHLALVVGAVLAFAACTTEFIEVDPLVDYGDEPGYEPAGEPVMELGYYLEQLYKPLPDVGGECPIIYGFQGGTWTMPALRMTGVATQANLACSLVTSDGEVLGDVEAQERFYLAPDLWVEVQAFPVPAAHAPPNEDDSIEDVYGLEATLACSATDDAGRMADKTVQCTLVEG